MALMKTMRAYTPITARFANQLAIYLQLKQSLNSNAGIITRKE